MSTENPVTFTCLEVSASAKSMKYSDLTMERKKKTAEGLDHGMRMAEAYAVRLSTPICSHGRIQTSDLLVMGATNSFAQTLETTTP